MYKIKKYLASFVGWFKIIPLKCEPHIEHRPITVTNVFPCGYTCALLNDKQHCNWVWIQKCSANIGVHWFFCNVWWLLKFCVGRYLSINLYTISCGLIKFHSSTENVKTNFFMGRSSSKQLLTSEFPSKKNYKYRS